MTQDWIASAVLFAGIALGTIAYVIRVLLKGRAQFDRVDRQGGSALLGKSVMEAGYWMLQPFARLLIFFHITANQISWASFALGLIAGVCLAFGHFGSGAVFATVSAVFDTLDGIVARETGTASDAGEVLDATVDRYAEFFFLGGLAVYYREIPALLILTLCALAGSFMVSYSTAKAEALQVSPPKSNMRRPERAIYLTLGAALSTVTIPWFESVREIAIPVGHPMVIAICLVAVLANISAIERLWAIARAMREREAEALLGHRRKSAATLASELDDQESEQKLLHNPKKA